MKTRSTAARTVAEKGREKLGNQALPTVYGLLGRNGSGKSTAIKMMLGMVHPDSGRVELFGEDGFRLKPQTRARIAYLAEGHPLYRWMTIGETVRFTRAFSPTWSDALLGQILDHFWLSPRARIRRLSGGERAQVSLALAVAADPELLILDDPTLGLDTVVRRDFLESLIQIIQRRGRTILFSSHILGDVERVADRIGILVDGVLRGDCPTDHFKDSIRRVVLRRGSRLVEATQPASNRGRGGCHPPLRATGQSVRRRPLGGTGRQGIGAAIHAPASRSSEDCDLNPN